MTNAETGASRAVMAHSEFDRLKRIIEQGFDRMLERIDQCFERLLEPSEKCGDRQGGTEIDRLLVAIETRQQLGQPLLDRGNLPKASIPSAGNQPEAKSFDLPETKGHRPDASLDQLRRLIQEQLEPLRVALEQLRVSQARVSVEIGRLTGTSPWRPLGATAPTESPSTSLSDVSKTWNLLRGGDPMRSVSAAEGERQIRGEASRASVIDALPFVGGRDHCVNAALYGDRAPPNPLTVVGTCAITGAIPGAVIGALVGVGALSGALVGACTLVVYGALRFLGWLFGSSRGEAVSDTWRLWTPVRSCGPGW